MQQFSLSRDEPCPSQRPQGEERAPTSRPRRRRSDTSGTRFCASATTARETKWRSVASPSSSTRLSRPFSCAALVCVFGSSGWLSRRSQTVPLLPWHDSAASGAPAARPSRPTDAFAAPPCGYKHLRGYRASVQSLSLVAAVSRCEVGGLLDTYVVTRLLSVRVAAFPRLPYARYGSAQAEPKETR